jgi:hypothetical protein
MVKWKGCGRKRSWANFKVLSGIRVEGLRETTKNVSEDSRSLEMRRYDDVVI